MEIHDAVSLPYAAKLLKKQTPESLQFCDKQTFELISFKEKFFEIAQDWGEISAYKSYPPKQLKKIMTACDVLENPDRYIPLPRADRIDHHKFMLEFASAQRDSDASKKLKAAANAIFGNRFKRFMNEIEHLMLEDEWSKFADGCYISVLRDWCEKNDLPCTDELIEPPEETDEPLADDDADDDSDAEVSGGDSDDASGDASGDASDDASDDASGDASDDASDDASGDASGDASDEEN